MSGRRISLRHVKPGTREPASAKETLAAVWNGWLTEGQIAKARALAADPDVTEEQAQTYLNELEDSASDAHGTWEWTL